MGLDIYAGTLTRYYAQNWKSAVQQWAEANGYTFNRITPEGENIEEERPEPAEVEEAMKQWRDWLLDALAADGQSYLPWPEDNERPYYTDKPDWPAWGALLLYGACLMYKERWPESVERQWDFEADPLVQRAMADEAMNWSLFKGITFWLPIEGAFWFVCQDPAGNECAMATLGALRSELEKINALGWQAEEAAILSWTDTEGYPIDGEVADGKWSKTGQKDAYNTQSLAKFAFAMLYQALLFAEQETCAIILDY